VLRCIAACCRVLLSLSLIPSRECSLGFVLCCSVFRCVAVCCSVLQCGAVCHRVAVCCGVFQLGAVCCSLSRSFPREHAHGVLYCAAVCCSVLQCVAVCCSVLQCVAVWCSLSLPRSLAKILTKSCKQNPALLANNFYRVRGVRD